jgi:hypothetical protein
MGASAARKGGERNDRALTMALAQLGVMVAIISFTIVLAVASGLAARLFFMAAAACAGAYYVNRSPWLFLTCTLWFWTVTPFVRRVVNLYSGFQAQDIILLTPSLLLVFMLKDVLRDSKVLRQREFGVGMLILCPMIYGVVLTLFCGDILSGALAGVDWFLPTLYYFYLLVHSPIIEEAEPHFSAFFTINLAVMVGYGLYQFTNPPPWDVLWALSSVQSAVSGNPVPFEIRVFGTMNSPAHLAIWTGSLLVLSLHFRTRIGVLLLPFAILLLVVTLVRSMLGCALAGLLIAGVLGGPRMSKPLLIMGATVLLVAGFVSVLDPDVSDRLIARVSSIQHLGEDASAYDRTLLYTAAPGLIDAVPFGLGLGALGHGSTASSGALANLDSGFIAIFLGMGWIGGSVYLFGVLSAAAQAVIAAKTSRSNAALALAAVTVSAVLQLAFTAMFGFYACLVWMMIGYASAIGLNCRQRTLPPRAFRAMATGAPDVLTLAP